MSVEARRWSVLQIATSSLAIVAAYLLSQVVGMSCAMAVALATGRADDAEEWLERVGADGLTLAIVTIVSAVVCIPAVHWSAARVEPRPWSFVGFVKGRRAGIVLWVALAALMAAYELANSAFGRPLIHPFVAEAYASAGSVALLAVAMVVAAPLFEEVVFRGFLFSMLRTRAGVAASAIATAALWSIVHVQYDALELSYIFALGLLLAWARAKTDSIATPIALHATVNLLTLLQVAMAAG